MKIGGGKLSKCKLKYVLDDGCGVLGLIWETPKGQVITLEKHIDPSRIIRVRDAEYGETVKEIEMISVIEEILNVECEKPEEDCHQITMDEYLESLEKSDRE